jgi:hypothetical protein
MSDKKRFVDYYFCLNSPWVYLAQKRLEEIAASNQATIQYFPVDLREMMLRLIGHDDPPARSGLHKAYGKLEMQRWAKRYGLPLSEKPAYYPVSQKRAACMVASGGSVRLGPRPLGIRTTPRLLGRRSRYQRLENLDRHCRRMLLPWRCTCSGRTRWRRARGI